MVVVVVVLIFDLDFVEVVYDSGVYVAVAAYVLEFEMHVDMFGGVGILRRNGKKEKCN